MRRVFLLVCLLALVGAAEAQKPKLPRERRLDSGIELRRDPETGELRYRRAVRAATSPTVEESPAAIRVRVNLVELSVNVLLPNGDHVLGLGRDDFRIQESGVPQEIVHFDASTEPASVALVFDASPSVFREIGEMKQAARTMAAHLGPRDEVAVLAFSASTHLVLPFSTDRAQLEQAIEAVAVSRTPADERGSHIYEAVYLAAQELFPGRRGRKAIVLLTDGQDSGLGLDWGAASAQPRAGASADRLTFEDLCRTLTAAGVDVYVISTQNRPKAMTEEWLTAHRGQPLVTPQARELGMAHYTLYLAELVRRAGGRIYFLRELPTLADVYRRIAENLRAQYTLGYYPPESAKPGWRALRVEVPGRADVRVPHRAAYYVPAGR
jgi:Ca-activated chloride channel family protein